MVQNHLLAQFSLSGSHVLSHRLGPVGPAPAYGFCVHTGCDPVCPVGSLWFHILTAGTSIVGSSFHSHSSVMLCLCHCSLYANGMEFGLHVEVVLSVYAFKQNPAAIAALWKQFVNIMKNMQSLDSPVAYSQFLNHLGLTGPRLQPDAIFLYIFPDSPVDYTHWL